MTTRLNQRRLGFALVQAIALFFVVMANGTPANKAALEKHYDRFLARNLARCATCHLPSENKNPESLDEFPQIGRAHV